MKVPYRDTLSTLQRQYHRQHPWKLGDTGFFIPHSYEHKNETDLSWWDDVGFILNKRRVIVWWQHPRMTYSNRIGDAAWAEAGPMPSPISNPFEGGEKIYAQVGASRKKLRAIAVRSGTDTEERNYFARQREIERRIEAEGIDYEVRPSWSVERLDWARGVNLVAPMEVRNEGEARQMAHLARALLAGETTLEAEFPGYVYDRAAWMAEAQQRALQRSGNSTEPARILAMAG